MDEHIQEDMKAIQQSDLGINQAVREYRILITTISRSELVVESEMARNCAYNHT